MYAFSCCVLYADSTGEVCTASSVFLVSLIYGLYSARSHHTSVQSDASSRSEEFIALGVICHPLCCDDKILSGPTASWAV